MTNSSGATAGASHFPRGVPPAVTSLLLFILAVHSPERIEAVARVLVGT